MAVNEIEYEARYCWTPQFTLLIVATAIMGAGALLPGLSVADRIIVVIVFWVSGLVLIAMARRRRGQLALRVDARGIAFGAPRKVDVPWGDLEAVVVFPVRRIRHIGLQRRVGAEALPGGPGRVTRALNQAIVPGLPGDVVNTCLPISGWGLDLERMTAAVAAHAPGVRVYDLTQ
ncbi:MAG: hypothetical protein ACRDS0_36540 [Pseudonocardiaceae bacterium]